MRKNEKLPFRVIVNIIGEPEILEVIDDSKDGYFVTDLKSHFFVTNKYVVKEIYEYLDKEQIQEKYPEYFI